MKKISISQKKIIIITLIVIGAFISFLIFVYLPSKDSVKNLKAELTEIESAIKYIEEKVIGQGKTIEEGIQSLNARYQELNKRFPSKEEESLVMISEFARKLNIEIVSISPQPKVAFLSAGSPISIEGKTCQRFAVSIQMRCLYKDLVRYLEALKKDIPMFTTIEGLTISRDSSTQTLRLNVSLGLSIYLLS